MKSDWIIVVRFGEDHKYFVRVNTESGEYHELYDPNAATGFSSATDAQQWIEKQTALSEYMTPEKREPNVEEFRVFVENGMVRRVFPLLSESSLNVKYDAKKHTEEDVIRWWYEYRSSSDPDSVVSSEVYRTWPNICDLTKYLHIWDFDVFCSDDFTKRNVVPELVFRKGKADFEQFEREITYLLDNYELGRTPEGSIFFCVFDHYLHEGGNYVTLVLDESGKWAVKHRGLYDTVEPSSLRECFIYLANERYYNDYF